VVASWFFTFFLVPVLLHVDGGRLRTRPSAFGPFVSCAPRRPFDRLDGHRIGGVPVFYAIVFDRVVRDLIALGFDRSLASAPASALLSISNSTARTLSTIVS